MEMTARSGEERKTYLDAVKGFCMLFVLLCHAQGVPLIGGLVNASFMQVFFVIAGYTYKDRPGETFGAFAKRKFDRLVVPYFCYAGLALLIRTALKHYGIAEILRGGRHILCEIRPLPVRLGGQYPAA